MRAIYNVGTVITFQPAFAELAVDASVSERANARNRVSTACTYAFTEPQNCGRGDFHSTMFCVATAQLSSGLAQTPRPWVVRGFRVSQVFEYNSRESSRKVDFFCLSSLARSTCRPLVVPSCLRSSGFQLPSAIRARVFCGFSPLLRCCSLD